MRKKPDPTRKDAERERRIRERAYEIWLNEGRPTGRDKAHWDMASEMVAQEEPPEDALEPNPTRHGVQHATRDEPVEPPEAIENQGEFPGLRDQGEESPRAPRVRRTRR